MKNVAIVTARAGSKSIIDKNVMTTAGIAMVQHPIRAAAGASKIDGVFVSTDGDKIAAASEEAGATIIPRPDELGGDTVNHGVVIRHAVEWVLEQQPDLENVVLLLGNTAMLDSALIDQALQVLDDKPDIDSVMTVWEAADDHPFRALEIVDGLVRPFGGERQVSTERQSYPKAYYYDQGVWAFRKHTVFEETGPNPWWWMGKRVHPILRTWVTGRDVHTHFDHGVQEWWLREGHKLQAADDAALEQPADGGQQ